MWLSRSCMDMNIGRKISLFWCSVDIFHAENRKHPQSLCAAVTPHSVLQCWKAECSCNQQQNEVQWVTRLVKITCWATMPPDWEALLCVCVRVCVCSLLFTLLKMSFADGIFSWMKMYLLFVKRAEFQKQKVYNKCLKREKIEIKTQKACIVYNSLFLLKFKFAAERANAPPWLKSLRSFSRAMRASLRRARMRRAAFLIY